MAVILTAKNCKGRGCACCSDFGAKNKTGLRRATKRTERQTWKTEVRGEIR